MNFLRVFLTVTGFFLAINGRSDELYAAHFSGSCFLFDAAGKARTIRVKTGDLIDRCAGSGAAVGGQYALAYNKTAQIMQVVQLAGGSPVCDLLQLTNAVVNTNGNWQHRFDYLFSSDETAAVGAAAIAESQHRPDKVSFEAHVVFILPSPGGTNTTTTTTGGATNSNSSSATNSTATNTTATAASGLSIITPANPSITDTNSTNTLVSTISGTNSTVTTTNGSPAITDNSTNTVAPTNSTSTSTNIVIGISPGVTTTNETSTTTSVFSSSGFSDARFCFGTFTAGRRIGTSTNAVSF